MPTPPSDELAAAAADYRWLLDRGYPDQGALRLVGDRYRLSGVERNTLYRGVFSDADSRRRAARLVDPEALARDGDAPDAPDAPGSPRRDSGAVSTPRAPTGRHGAPPLSGAAPCEANPRAPGELTVDGHNVLFTVWNCLAGRPIVLATDRFVRDIGGTRSRLPHDERFERVARLVCAALAGLRLTRVRILLDEPLPWSRDHVGVIARVWEEVAAETSRHPGSHVAPELVAATDPSVDAEVARTTSGLIATSDTAIVDRCAVPVLDLGGLVVVRDLRARPLPMEELCARG